MWTKFRTLTKTAAIGDLATLITSQVIVKLLALLGTVVALRALGPERLGQAAQFTLIAAALYQALGLGIDVVGPQILSSADEEDRASVATSLLLMRLGACSLSLVLLPLVAAWDAFRAHAALGPDQVGLALVGGLWMLTNTAGAPQFIAQGYGKVRTLVVPQVVSSVLLVAGHWIFTLHFLRADVFLLVQSTAGIAYAALTMRQLRINPFRLKSAVWKKCRAEITGPEAHGAWVLTIATYVVNDGGLLLMSFLCTRAQLGDLNAAQSLVSAAWGLLMWVSYVIYSRQLLWMRDGNTTFCRQQRKALRLSWYFALGGGAAAFVAAPYPSHLLLGRSFTTAPTLFAILCACLFLTLPYTTMSGAMSAAGRNRPQARVIFTWACLALPCYFPAILHFGTVGGAWMRIGILAGVTFFQYRVYARFMRELDGQSVSAAPMAESLALSETAADLL